MVYDMESSTRNEPNATGDVPEPRTRFCGGVTWPDHKSSFNTDIYGGLRPEAATINGSMAYDDVCILTLPALVWIKWNQNCGTVVWTSLAFLRCYQWHANDHHGQDVPQLLGLPRSIRRGQHNLNLRQATPDNSSWSPFVLDFSDVKPAGNNPSNRWDVRIPSHFCLNDVRCQS